MATKLKSGKALEFPEVNPDSQITLFIEVWVPSMQTAQEIKEICNGNGVVRRMVAKFDDPVVDLMDD